jgi:parvulin-like peptidyl-prolyl isomerase
MTETGYMQGTFRTLLFFTALCLSGTAPCEQVLATVGTTEITDTQLANALGSAPFATQFPSMDEDQQAALRGDMLVRLVDAEILRQEALALGLDQDPDFKKEVINFRTGLLYRSYIQNLRDSITIPESVDLDLKQRYKGNPDALAAARSTYISKRFKPLKAERLKALEKHYHVHLYGERLTTQPTVDTVLAEGDFFAVRYADIQALQGEQVAPDQEAERLQSFVEITLAARAALDNGINVEPQVTSYKNDLLPRILIEKKEHEWSASESAVRDYYQQHPEIGYTPARYHVGQLVLGSQDEADAMRKRILAGESLFVLASASSIDPVGRKQAGDMGWVNEGSGFPALEAAIKDLKEGEVSEVIETPRGFHLVMIIDRAPGRQRPLTEIPDRVRQAMITEQVPAYLKGLAAKHPVKWTLPVQKDEKKAATGSNT